MAKDLSPTRNTRRIGGNFFRVVVAVELVVIFAILAVLLEEKATFSVTSERARSLLVSTRGSLDHQSTPASPRRLILNRPQVPRIIERFADAENAQLATRLSGAVTTADKLALVTDSLQRDSRVAAPFITRFLSDPDLTLRRAMADAITDTRVRERNPELEQSLRLIVPGEPDPALKASLIEALRWYESSSTQAGKEE